MVSQRRNCELAIVGLLRIASFHSVPHAFRTGANAATHETSVPNSERNTATTMPLRTGRRAELGKHCATIPVVHLRAAALRAEVGNG
ncbi:hypothetical protein Bcep1808_7372 (plasmid) [Burkholderia vietnamiensis G4]|uniref:Uncharacterized protein n=1 Tax=Burkholderia vietnamiensis (strain G4 / LMG 22486) TaxID=269482 RepID=A4JVE6_BURVG|nr:hypothetical protein Bcep1808_7372 [Burkholderia vietnamiensis G4]